MSTCKRGYARERGSYGSGSAYLYLPKVIVPKAIESTEDLYTRLKGLQRHLEFLDIQVPVVCPRQLGLTHKRRMSTLKMR
jgi:hypothetical protein